MLRISSRKWVRKKRKNEKLKKKSLKKAEDGNGIIIRLLETEGKDSLDKINLPFLKIKRIFQTNLVEENEKTIPSRVHGVEVPIKSFGLVTIRVENK